MTTANEASAALTAAAQGPGSYCLRASSSSPGACVLVVMSKVGNILNYKIARTSDEGVEIELRNKKICFPSLMDCLNYYKTHPELAAKQGGLLLTDCIQYCDPELSTINVRPIDVLSEENSILRQESDL